MSNSGAIGRDPAAPVREREAPEGRGEHETPDTRGEHGGLEARGQHETTEAHSQHETTEARGERSTAETNSQREVAESHGSHRAVPQWDTNAVSAVPPLTTARLVLARDLKLAFRKRSQLVQPLAFFAIVTTLFPLGVSPELPRLKPMAAGVVWAAALLSSLLALELLFRDDAQDGTLEQYALSGRSLTWLLAAKTAAHWLLTGLPLALMAPLAGMALGAPAAAVPGIVASVAVGTVALSLIGSVGAGLTLGIRRSGALLSLLTLPLEIPVLIFGARATELAIDGAAYGVPLQLLGALAVLGLTLAPLAAAAAVRINLE